MIINETEESLIKSEGRSGLALFYLRHKKAEENLHRYNLG